MSDTPPEDTAPGTDYVRPDSQTPKAANPFDNGTAEPQPALGDPNGTPLEDVLSHTPPEVYEDPPATGDVQTAKSLGIDTATGVAASPLTAEVVPAVAPTGQVGEVVLTAEQVAEDPQAVADAQAQTYPPVEPEQSA